MQQEEEVFQRIQPKPASILLKLMLMTGAALSFQTASARRASTSRHMPERTGIRDSNRYNSIHSTITHSVQQEKTAQCPEWMSGYKSVVYSMMEYFQTLPILFNLNKIQKHPIT